MNPRSLLLLLALSAPAAATATTTTAPRPVAAPPPAAASTAALTAYQQAVLKTFADAGTDGPLRAAYAAQAAGTATAAQRQTIRTSEMIHEDLKLSACVRPALAGDATLDDVLRRVVAAGQGAALIADAKRLFPQSEWSATILPDAPAEEQAIAAAVLIAGGARPQSSEGAAALKALERRMVLNYYLTYATDGKCTASPRLRQLIGKAR